MPKSKERLSPTSSTVKKLFAYSGNECAVPDCKKPLVHKSGTMIGKIAHICAAEKGGARYVASMTSEQRRHFDNLIIVCGEHHDVIDDKANIKDYPAELLRKWKASHEDRFKRAERQLLETFADTTQATKPTYPKNLKALASATGDDDLLDAASELKGIREFIDKLKELPLEQRQFAVKLAERMMRHNVDELLTSDVTGAFVIGDGKLKKHMKLIEHHALGSIDEGNEYQKYMVRLWDRKPSGNPWIEMLEFCERTGASIEELIFDLNFALYEA